jgi:hypothetical protein
VVAEIERTASCLGSELERWLHASSRRWPVLKGA